MSQMAFKILLNAESTAYHLVDHNQKFESLRMKPGREEDEIKIERNRE